MKVKYHDMLGDFHIGKIIKDYIDAHKISKAALARKIKRNDSTILTYQKSASLQVGIVLELSHALKHNFFADIAAQLPNTYTTNVVADATKDERIVELEKQVELLTAKYEAAMEIAKGK